MIRDCPSRHCSQSLTRIFLGTPARSSQSPKAPEIPKAQPAILRGQATKDAVVLQPTTPHQTRRSSKTVKQTEETILIQETCNDQVVSKTHKPIRSLRSIHEPQIPRRPRFSFLSLLPTMSKSTIAVDRRVTRRFRITTHFCSSDRSLNNNVRGVWATVGTNRLARRRRRCRR